MTKSEIYKKLLLEYQKEKDAADKLYRQRIDEIYQLIPDIKKIDDDIMHLNIGFARNILEKKQNKDNIKIIAEKNKKLLSQKETTLKQYGINKDFFDSVYKCKYCKDTGFINNKECACFKKRLIETAYNMSNLKSILEEENFDKFNINFYTKKEARERIESNLLKTRKFIENFDTDFSNLYLYGKTGLGKTFLCNCIAKELLDRGKIVLYLSAVDLFKTLEENKFEENDSEKSHRLSELIFDTDLLIIDDLGTEFQTSFTSSEFFNIINTRFLKKKPIVISTNLSPKEIGDKYSDRIVSRFYGNYKFLEFLGEDIRILKLPKG